MSCDSKGINPQRVNQFNKIRLLNDVANQIAYYALQCGNETVFDYIDLNCGCIPEGEFEQVVDLDSPHQFLQMYMQTAEKRFAYSVTVLLRMNPSYINQLEEFCGRVGQDIQLPKVNSLEQAYGFLNNFYLDGMPCDEVKKIIHIEENELTWQKLIDTHETAWEKAGGNLEIYYKLLTCFVNGLFKESNIILEIKDNTYFSLKK